MTLIEGVLKDHVFIDFGSEIMYGDDQMYLDYPCRFATVGFELMATSLLGEIADRIRKDRGYKPMHPDRKSTRLNSSHPTTSRMPSSA